MNHRSSELLMSDDRGLYYMLAWVLMSEGVPDARSSASLHRTPLVLHVNTSSHLVRSI
jgi:hypothetical protein